MGSAPCRADSNEPRSFCCPAVHYQGELVIVDLQAGFDEVPIHAIPGEEGPSREVDERDISSRTPSRGLFLFGNKLTSAKHSRWQAQRCHEYVIGNTPILPDSDSDVEPGEKVTKVHINSDIAQALRDNGDDKYESRVDSAQSNRMETALLIVNLNTWEIASDQNPGAQPAHLWPKKAAVEGVTSSIDMSAESVRSATEKVVVVNDAATDDVKQTPNLECLVSDGDKTRGPCEISNQSGSLCKMTFDAPKGTHLLKYFSTCGGMSSTEEVGKFLNSFSTCGSISSTKEDQSACFQQKSIHAAPELMNRQILDGVWMLDDGSGVTLPVACVKGSDVKLLGDGEDLSFQLEAMGAGVWSTSMEDEELLVDCSDPEDGRLLLHWSNGVTWVRKEEGAAIDSVSSISSSSCSSSSSSSSESTPTAPSSIGPVEAGRTSEVLEVIAVGETAELVPAAEASKVSEKIDFDGLEDQVFKINEADKVGDLGAKRSE